MDPPFAFLSCITNLQGLGLNKIPDYAICISSG